MAVVFSGGHKISSKSLINLFNVFLNENKKLTAIIYASVDKRSTTAYFISLLMKENG